ncbi:MAG: 3-hydroxyacyl-CoA dehydrogenase NAD-binding domain-containing protein [Paludisphaera borealis]|uniref:3-hydroxyacyl-CoA dehydrogenase NAD-binding domain-containing protein n=1 Tax=Paludisphaera borealis TaxID=1387353 RepID=UPI00284CD9E0|nr:3-hydroxyacyl-CoA dehydrogenase NAD-binding domain-containing protein [Paludisphaera borealis]MDR3620795.1 3-hydroxyacyl-CoA dehydrogenase NAD-binding domain-containing protein [Paludisphaera borealis]
MSAIDTGVDRIAVVGCGVIGASWAAHYLARGFDVAATDPAPDAEKRLREVVERAWPVLERIGLADGAAKERLRFEPDLASALKGADFVQENGPERLNVKRELIARIDAGIRDDVLIASSTSGILISEFQDAARRPERVLLGHPFNPPHLIPLVEVVGGKLTSPEAIDRAMRFYAAVGKKPIHIRREMKGHVANRLQAALWREAFSLVDQGVATVADIDAAIAHGPGLRWALLGPFLNLHLSGGEGGIAHVIDHLGPPMEDWWRDLGDFTFTEAVKAEAVEGVDDELKGRSLPAMIRQRDDVLLALLALKAKADQLP